MKPDTVTSWAAYCLLIVNHKCHTASPACYVICFCSYCAYFFVLLLYSFVIYQLCSFVPPLVLLFCSLGLFCVLFRVYLLLVALYFLLHTWLFLVWCGLVWMCFSCCAVWFWIGLGCVFCFFSCLFIPLFFRGGNRKVLGVELG